MSERLRPSRHHFNRWRRLPNHQFGQHQQWHSRGHQQQGPWRYNQQRLRDHHRHHQIHGLCYRCGGVFNRDHLSHCRARFVRCHSCYRYGHLARMCANLHVHQAPRRTSGRKPLKHTVTVQNTNRQVPNTISSSTQTNNCDYGSDIIASEHVCLIKELPFGNISQTDLISETSAIDREFRLEKKLCSVVDRMEEEKMAHSRELLSVLEKLEKHKVTSNKFKDDNEKLTRKCDELKSRVDQTIVEREELKDECNRHRKDLEDFKTESSMAINSVSNIEEEKQSLETEVKNMQQAMKKIQEQRDYYIEKYELYSADNRRLGTDMMQLREEMKRLRQVKNNNRGQQRRF